MAHVGGQHREFGLEIRPVAIPLRQAVDGEGVPQIMESGPLAAPPVRDTTHPQEMPEDRVEPALRVGAAVRGRKKHRLGRSVAHHVGILPQTLGERRRQRHQTVLAELALTNGEDAHLHIDISDL